MLEFTAGNGRTKVVLKLENTGRGWYGSLTGGESPHVGGVVLAIPRRSLTGEGSSADLYLTPVPGHKDLEAAAPLAKSLAGRLGTPVSLTAGIHVDDASGEIIGEILNNCSQVLALFFETLSGKEGK